MLLSNIFLVLGGSIGITTAYILKPGVRFYKEPYWAFERDQSLVINPEEGKCTGIPVQYEGSMKMLGSGMECAVFSNWTSCDHWVWRPMSKWRRSPDDNTPKSLDEWLDMSGLDAGDRSNIGHFTPSNFICRSWFNHLADKDSSSNNVHKPHDGWHEPGEQWGGLDMVVKNPYYPDGKSPP